MKMTVLDGFTLNPGDLSWERLEAMGDLTVYDNTPLEERVARAKGSEAVFVNKVKVDEEMLASLPELRYLGVLATGYNTIDLDACKKHNVAVTTVPAYGGAAVAQFAMGLLLELCHHTCARIRDVRKGEWASYERHWYDWVSGMQELSGKTMGIVGLGNIGRELAKMARGFGMNVIAYSRTERPEDREVATYKTLDEVLKESDVLSLHLPLTEKTYHIINEESIAKMKDGAILLNVSRGPLVDEKALTKALQEKKLAAAALDVTEKEPLPEGSPLLACDNCLITPHIAWGAREARERLLHTAVDNFKSFLDGKEENRLV